MDIEEWYISLDILSQLYTKKKSLEYGFLLRRKEDIKQLLSFEPFSFERDFCIDLALFTLEKQRTNREYKNICRMIGIIEDILKLRKMREFKGLNKEKAKQVDIEAVASTFGYQVRNHQMKCFLHDDKTPSMHLYPNNTYHCFGCNEGGDVIDFVMKYFHQDFKSAVEWLLKY